MPTVPPTFVHNDHLGQTVPGPAPFSIGSFFDQDRDDTASGPTPDPDVEDFTIEPNGNAVTEIGPPAHSSAAALTGSHQTSPPSSSPCNCPSLGSLSLNSPSAAIIGTPFDLSPRFEYPFPSASSTTAVASVFDHDGFPYHYGHPLLGAYGHGHLPDWAGYPVSSSAPDLSSIAAPPPRRHWAPGSGFQRSGPIHPKLRIGEPPIPPSLSKKWCILREKEKARSEFKSNQRPGVKGITTLRPTFTGQDVHTVQLPAHLLPSADAIPRPPSAERRESDETVVGSLDGHGEKVPLDEICPQTEPAVALITSTEDTQIEVSTLVSAEEAEVKPTTVQPVLGNELVPSHGCPTHSLIDASLKIRLDSLPASPLGTIATSPSTVCTAGFCPAYEVALASTYNPSVVARKHILHDLHEQMHEPHDYDRNIQDTLSMDASAPIYDGAQLPSDDSVPAPAPIHYVATPSDS
ncbi:hypothetical protein C8Q72DRAFT_453197 [Fomitopsis betulina]|nr:hypothetical protein C8Q72DRAFT_453197 [Fomitopsis betulina]